MMGKILGKCCKRRRVHEEALSLLLLGLENAGKTEIAFKVCNDKRDDFDRTKGCRLFETNIGNSEVKLIEIGGGKDLRDIWKYYFLDALGIIFVIDASNISSICESYTIFKNLITHEYLTGKPFLLLANKQDLPSSVDCIEICDYLDVEYLANAYRTPCLVEASGNWQDPTNEEYDGLAFGIGWLVNMIVTHRQHIQNRINFHKLLMERSSSSTSNVSRTVNYPRPQTSGMKKKKSGLSIKDVRPKTAPTVQEDWQGNSNRNFLTKRNSVISVKTSKSPSLPTPNANKVTPPINGLKTSQTSNRDAITCEDSAVCKDNINKHSISKEKHQTISNGHTEMAVDDLSLPPTTNNNPQV